MSILKVLRFNVLIAAMGYFVDMFDLTIFGVVRIASLKALGITDPAELTSIGVMLLNLQAAGMLLGGFFWGILADKKGRLSVLFASIICFSVANILNGFVTEIWQYGVLRFIAGIGLAGELGVAVTLVSETMSKEDRGYGTTVIATLGLLGAVAAALVGQYMDWRWAFWIGGILGLLLLAGRVHMADSEAFQKLKKSTSKTGDLTLLFNKERGIRYIYCVLVGVPIYFITGILFTFSPEVSSSLGFSGITAGNALLFGSIGLTVGDLLSGLASQMMKSRKKAVALFMVLGLIGVVCYFTVAPLFDDKIFYTICFLMGVAAGYWAVLITIAAEQFGTNIRATVATSVPNLVRSAVIPLTLIFTAFKTQVGVYQTAMLLGAFVFAMAFFALYKLNETYGKELDYTE
jgi:MFS transporter, putative metabolite:H+ symporter